MGRFSLGASAVMGTFKLYDDTGALSVTNADLCLFHFVDNAFLESTSPDYSAEPATMSFTTNRKDVASTNFFKKFAINVEAAEEVERLNEAGFSVKELAISNTAKKFLTIWISNVELFDTAGSTKTEITAGVGYWAKSSRNLGSTAGNQENKYTWQFNCVKAGEDEMTYLKSLTPSGNILGPETGYGGSIAATRYLIGKLTGTPLADWDDEDALQQLIVNQIPIV
jgi:hypothetical protein